MTTYHQKNFLDQFDQPIRKYIIEYCKKISEKKYDVYILLARKAACFLTALEDLGFITFNGVVVSDRILEYNTKWLEGKNVAIIDDTIISGTSICKIIEKLKRIGVANISVHAFCINNYWFVDDMLRDDDKEYLVQPYMRVEHASSIRFCRQIVEALSIIPRPYNIDFPVYEIGKLSKRQYSLIIEDKNWKIVDTATLLQKEYNVGCVSLNFRRDLLSQFNNHLGCDISQVLFVKLRLFTKELFDNVNAKQSRYSCKVVPYVIFNPIKHGLTQKLIETICECENISLAIISDELKTENSKLFFIQFYFAARLIKWWMGYTYQLLGKELLKDVNLRSLYLLFPPSIVDLVNKFSFDKKISISPEIFHDTVLCNHPKLAEGAAPVNPLEIKAKLTNRFLGLYYNKELPARRIVKEKGKKAFQEKSYQDIINRLEDGISLDSLKNDISLSVNNATDRNLILSTFLDNAIDRGIIVPITALKDGYVYRGFRHGEEVIWGDANDKLMAKFFEAFAGEEGIISKFWFEKLLVIFLKIGLKQKFLNEYDQTTPENQTIRLIGVRSYLYGQVSVTYEIRPYDELNYSPILDSDTKSYWTTMRLQDFGLISQEKDQSGYKLNFRNLHNRNANKYLQNEVDIDLDQEHVGKVLNMADVLKLCKDSGLLKSSGLVMLTSCLGLHDNTASIGAELQIYTDHLQSYANKIEGAIKFKGCTIEFLSSLRDAKTNFLWTAINSGKDKYFKFRQGKGINLVNDISKQLELQNRFAARHWNDYWRKDIELLQSQDDELNDLNKRMGLVLIDIQITIISIHLVLFEIARRESRLDEYVQRQRMAIFAIDKELKQLREELAGNDSEKVQKTISKKNAKRNNILKNLKYWEDYALENIDTINANLKELSAWEKSQMHCSEFVNNIINGEYKGATDSELSGFALDLAQTLSNLNQDAQDALKDFSALVPQWGKIRKTVRYLSFLHLNIKSDNRQQRERIGQIIKTELANFELEEYDELKNDKSIVILKVNEIKTGGRGYVLGAKGQRHDERLVKFGCRILSRCRDMGEHIIGTLCPSFSPEGYKAQYNPQTQLFDTVKEDLYNLLPENEEEDCVNIYVDNSKQNEDYAFPILMKYSLHKMFKAYPVNKTDKTIQFQITMKPAKKKIFISYSRKDVEFKEELKKHLAILGQAEVVDTWSCEQITIGQWDRQIKQQLEDSDLVIYMLSANFFSSSYILEQEVMKVLNNGPQKDVLCVIVSRFADLVKLEEFISGVLPNISDKQKAILALKEFQYLPYGKVKNYVTDQPEERIIPLKDYANETKTSIEQAFSQIVERVIDLFKQ